MSKQSTIKFDQGSFDKKILLLGQTVQEKLTEQLTDIASYATLDPSVSPLDTGAYVASFSFKSNTSSRGRRKSSKNKAPNTHTREEGFSGLVSDIEAMDFEDMTQVTLRNDSAHAQKVEEDHGYWVFAKIKDYFS